MPTRVVDLGVTSSIGRRPRQEDRYTITQPGEMGKGIRYFAVYDGHAGPGVSEHAHKHLHQHISNLLSDGNYGDALKMAMQAEDEALRREGLFGEGSTVAAALLDESKNELVVADLGDSHVVLAEDIPDREGKWRTSRLSREARPNADSERERIEAAGGRLDFSTGQGRIGERKCDHFLQARAERLHAGKINVSRALGDFDYKLPHVQKVDRQSSLSNGALIKHDLVSDEPHIRSSHLNGRSLLLLASDGVGEGEDAERTTEAAVKMISKGASADETAEALAQQCSKRQFADNCTIIIVLLES